MGPPQNKTKRKGIAEGRGELPRAPPGLRPPKIVINKSSIAGPAPQTSLSSKFSSSRHSATAPANSSHGNGSGSHRRGISYQGDRSQSVMVESRIQRTSSSTHRSNSSLEMHSQPPNGSQGIGNKGRIIFPSNPSDIYKSPMKQESNGCYDPRINCDLQWESSCTKQKLRDVSVASAPKGLAINGKTTPIVDMNASQTPSHIPLRTCTPSARVELPSPSKSSKKVPSSGRFLTRESNTLAAWDMDERMESMKHAWSLLEQKISGATSEGGLLKDMSVNYRTRSMQILVGCMKLS